MNMKETKNRKTERISTRALYIMVGAATVVFVLFYLVGYNIPYALEPEYNAPMLTDVLLVFTYAMLALAAGIAVWAVARGRRMHRRDDGTQNGIPARRIAIATAAMLALTLALTFALGGSEPIAVNGKLFTDGFWLRLTDMFISTIAIMLAAAAAATVYSMTGMNRRRRK